MISICGPKLDNSIGMWRRFNEELHEEIGMASITNFIKSKQIQWFKFVMCRSKDNTINGGDKLETNKEDTLKAA